MIWLLGTVVCAIAIAGLSAPWWRPAFTQRRALRRRAANVAAYRTRLQEIEGDVAAGVMNAEAAEALRQELGARLVDDVEQPVEPEQVAPASRLVPVIAAVALVVFGGAWYAAAGSWRTQDLIELSRTDPEGARQTALSRSIARLRERVDDEPQDVESWVGLARAYRARGSHADAAEAFARANELRGHQDPDLLVEEGEAVAWAQERSMAGVPTERFEQALALAPAHPQALWYAGIAAFQRGDHATTIARWELLLAQPIEDDMRAMIGHSLAQLRKRAGMPAATPAEPAPTQAAGVQLTVEVSVAPELASEVGEGHVLFVFAQDPSGPPMPLAVQRLPATGMPVRTTLDDSNSLMPTRKFSSLDRWRIVARISKTGSANPQAGDLEGTREVGRGEAGKPVTIRIDRRRP